MGCTTSKSTRIIYRDRPPNLDTPSSFTITVHNPENVLNPLSFSYDTDFLELPLIFVMNSLAFDTGEKGRKFDANFISIINEKTG
jgi:hypothetical protein